MNAPQGSVTAKRVIEFDPTLPDGTVANHAGMGATPSIAWDAEDLQPDEIIFLKEGEVILRAYNIGETAPADYWDYSARPLAFTEQ